MITLAEADDLHEIIRKVAQENGRDMSDMHAIADEVLGMPVGEATPVPGTLIVEPEPLVVFPPPMHEGWNMPPEGKFLLPISAERPVPRQVRRLSKRVSRLTYWLTGLTMCFISLLVVLVKTW